jgi:hypothetical protein
MVFIKTKMVFRLKFHPKLNGMPCQHQSHCATCPIINFLILKKKSIKKLLFFKLKIKNFGVTRSARGGFGQATQFGFDNPTYLYARDSDKSSFL